MGRGPVGRGLMGRGRWGGASGESHSLRPGSPRGVGGDYPREALWGGDGSHSRSLLSHCPGVSAIASPLHPGAQPESSTRGTGTEGKGPRTVPKSLQMSVIILILVSTVTSPRTTAPPPGLAHPLPAPPGPPGRWPERPLDAQVLSECLSPPCTGRNFLTGPPLRGRLAGILARRPDRPVPESPAGGHGRRTHVRSVLGTSVRGEDGAGEAGGSAGTAGWDERTSRHRGLKGSGHGKEETRRQGHEEERGPSLQGRSLTSPPRICGGLPRGQANQNQRVGNPAGLIQCHRTESRGHMEDTQLDAVAPSPSSAPARLRRPGRPLSRHSHHTPNATRTLRAGSRHLL